ncbi:MAG: hypothetical protein AAF597_19310 [Bacteroidota bacterium]
MRFRIILLLLVVAFAEGLSQDSSIEVVVEHYSGGGTDTYIFAEDGLLVSTYKTGGPIWRKDTVIRRVDQSIPGIEFQTITHQPKRGKSALLLEKSVGKGKGAVTVNVENYGSPLLEDLSFKASYALNAEGLIVEARIKRQPDSEVPYPDGIAVYAYTYQSNGACTVIDTFTKQVVLKLLLRKRRAVVRLPGRGTDGFEYVFDREGILRSISYREVEAGTQTDYRIGKNGLEISAAVFSTSPSGRPAPRHLWRLYPQSGKKVVVSSEIRDSIIRAILDDLALRNTGYRRFFPRCFSPAEKSR